MEFYKLTESKYKVGGLQEITDAQLERIIKAGWWAGTSFNLKPWKCLVLREKHRAFWDNFLRIITVLLRSNPLIPTIGIKPEQYAHYRDNAAATLILCGNESKVEPWFSGPIFVADGVKSVFFKDMGTVLQNLKLAILSEGLGYDQVNMDLALKGLDDALQAFIELPAGFRVISILTIGAPEQREVIHDIPLSAFIYHEQWRRRMKEECPQAATCDRFVLEHAPTCLMCKEVITGNHYYHSQSGRFLCGLHFQEWQKQDRDPAYFTKAKIKSRTKHYCVNWNDCDDFALFQPKKCYTCGREMAEHFYWADADAHQCLACYNVNPPR